MLTTCPESPKRTCVESNLNTNFNAGGGGVTAVGVVLLVSFLQDANAISVMSDKKINFFMGNLVMLLLLFTVTKNGYSNIQYISKHDYYHINYSNNACFLDFYGLKRRNVGD